MGRPDEVARIFALSLARQRERAGLSQEELGFRASLHRTEIGLLERGVRMPRVDTALKLAGALGIEIADLLGGLRWSPGAVHTGGWACGAEEPDR